MPQTTANHNIGHTITVRGLGRPLTGPVPPRVGSKNVALPAIVAIALAQCPQVTLAHVPDIGDVRVLLQIVSGLGFSLSLAGRGLQFCGGECRTETIPDALSAALRGSIYALILPAVFLGRARSGPIGGDILPGRSLEPHIRAFEGFGLKVSVSDGCLHVSHGPPRPSEFNLTDRPAGISATALALLLAAAADGESVIGDPSTEPEVEHLLALVNFLGASAAFDRSALVVRGPMTGRQGVYELPLDHLYYGTIAVCALMTNGEVTLPVAVKNRLATVLETLNALGFGVANEPGGIRIWGSATRGSRISTGPSPFFPTDLVPIFMALLTQVPGESHILENVYKSRFSSSSALRAMGADIREIGNRAVIRGSSSLQGLPVACRGIRETMSLIVAALAANGITHVKDASDVHRGYEDIVRDLSSLGAEISMSESNDQAYRGKRWN